jgi:hypothetical protein
LPNLTPEKKQELYKIKRRLATKSIYHLAKTAGHLVKSEDYKAIYETNEASTVSERVSKAQLAYRHKFEQAQAGRSLLNLNSEIIVGALSIATITAGPLGTTAVLTGAAITYGAKALLDYTMEKFDESSKSKAQSALAIHLDSLSQDYNQDLEQLQKRYEEAATESDRQQVLGELLAPERGIFKSDYAGLE